MNTVPRDADYYGKLLYELLPSLYRARDDEGELERFLALFGHELARLRGNVDQLWRDFYIDSCQDWVVPYIGDLVGTNIVFNDGADNRADVKNTIKWRRQKGTLPGLEDVAAVISGWGTLAVEMLTRLIWSQNLGHLRPEAIHAVALDDPAGVARIGTPFELACRSVDLRPPGQQAGWHRIRHVAFFLWSLRSHPWEGTEPRAAGARRFRFHPLGVDCPLHAAGRKEAGCPEAAGAPPAELPDVCHPHTDDTPIRARDFRDHPLRYFGAPEGFTVYEDGIPLCRTADTGPSRSTATATAFAELAAAAGLVVEDPALFGGGALGFRIDAARLAAVDLYSPDVGFAGNFTVLPGMQGRLDTDTFTYTKGLAFHPGEPDLHDPALLLRIERLGAAAAFPESELVARSAAGRYLKVYLPAIPALPAATPFYLYVADDGSTYFGRGDHGPGVVDRNPDASLYGAYLPRHLAREALGQARFRSGIARPIAGFAPGLFRSAVYRPLCCWDQEPQRPLASGEVAFDPERGRFLFPPGEAPGGELTVDFRFSRTGELGAGPFDRKPLDVAELPAANVRTVAEASDADVATVQAAIDALPDGSTRPVVVEVRDSRRYEESLSVAGRDFPGGLWLQAAKLETPVIVSAGGPVLQVTGATTIGGGLVLDGLVLAGGAVEIRGDVAAVEVRFCTLDPATVTLDVDPAAAATVELSDGIAGPVVCAAAVTRFTARDAVLHHPDAVPESAAGHRALDAAHAVELERTTVLGELVAERLVASNTILAGPLTLGDPGASCVRFSRHSGGVADLPTFNSTTAFPIFVDFRLDRPGYLHLHPNTSAAVRRGGENGGEMGAFYGAGIPWREQNLRLKVDEYLPAGLTAVPVHALPRTRFLGASRP